MKLALGIIGICILASCKVIDPPEEAPSLIRIDEITLETDYTSQGSNSNKAITDAWVYVEDELIGFFELPATIPILKSGAHNVKIYAGIKRNGIAGKRVKYPFYDPYTLDLNLIKDSVIKLSPVVNYNPDASIWYEDFETGAIKLYDNTNTDVDLITTNLTEEVYEGNFSGIGAFNDTDLLFEVKTDDESFYDFDFNDPVYIEMDYACNQEAAISIEFKKSSSSSSYQDVSYLILNPTDTSNIVWKKIYIDISEIVQANAPYEELNFVIGMQRNSEINYNPKMLLDNVKIVRL